MTIPETPDLRLARLVAKAQELQPEHTYKAVMRLIKPWPIEKKIEWLERGLAEFEKGMA